jgi:hypothetical protein
MEGVGLGFKIKFLVDVLQNWVSLNWAFIRHSHLSWKLMHEKKMSLFHISMIRIFVAIYLLSNSINHFFIVLIYNVKMALTFYVDEIIKLDNCF